MKLLKSTRVSVFRRFDAFCISIFAAVFPGFLNSGSALTLSSPTAQSGVVSFFFDSIPDQLFTVQSSGSLSSGWLDASYYLGTGAPISFSAQMTADQQFFRVRITAFQALELSPNSPTLATGPVSLPDAVVGASYLEQIFPALTGLPPYTMRISGFPPDAVTLIVTSNQTANASVQVVTTGLGLVADQRRQFTISVVDSLNTTNTRNYDLRVIAPLPQIAIDRLVLKAGEATNVNLTANGGTGPLSWSLISGTLPAGIVLSTNGLLAGTPTADASELNEDGRYTNIIEVADSFTDRITGVLSARKATNAVQLLVRLSYVLNIRASRTNGPSLRQTCFVCHGPGFLPDFEPLSALTLIHVKSGSGAECGTSRVYVAPRDPSDSLIYEKVTAPPCGERMPQGGPYLSDQRTQRLARWIRELTNLDTD
ncbi:MAG: hypothetical protein ABI651_03720 [Verrucomicrobiota bacterium]